MPLGYYQTNPLVALPPLLPFRVELIGTTDEMPGIGVAANSRVLDIAPALGFPAHLDGAHHAGTGQHGLCGFPSGIVARRSLSHLHATAVDRCGLHLSVRTPSLIEDEVDPNDPTTLIRTCTWNLAALGGARDHCLQDQDREGTTDNVYACYLVGERIDIGVDI